MICFKCEHEESEDFKFCPECGSRQTCHCGKVLKPSNKFCMECGTKVEDLRSLYTMQSSQQIIRQPIQQFVQKSKKQFIEKEKNTIISDDNGINIKLKGFFNIITTSMFFLTFLLALIALFTPINQITVWDIAANHFDVRNISIVTYIFFVFRYDAFSGFATFRAVYYLFSAIIIIIFIILGTIKGVRSFKDSNDVVAKHAVSITALLFVPLLFTSLYTGTFLRITVIFAFISIFTKIIFNIILNRKKLATSKLISYIFSISASLILIFSITILFGRTFEVSLLDWGTLLRGSVFDFLEIFRQLYIMSREFGSLEEQDLYRELHSRFLMISIVSTIVMITLVSLLQTILTKAVRTTTTKNNNNFIFISVSLFLIIILWIFNVTVTGSFYVEELWFNGSWWDFWWRLHVNIRLNTNNLFAFLLAFLALGLSIAGSIIYSANKNKVFIESVYKKQESQTKFINQSQVSKLSINKITGILTLVNVGLIFLLGLLSVFVINYIFLIFISIFALLAILLEIVLIVLYIVALVKSKQNNISILGHVLGLVSIGLYFLSGVFIIISIISFTLFGIWLSLLISFAAFVLTIIAGIFLLTAKPKISYQQDIQPAFQQLNNE